MYGYRREAPLGSDPQAHIQVFQTGSSARPLVMKVQRVSREEVETLVKSSLRLMKTFVLLPGPLVAIQVCECGTERKCEVEWIFDNPERKDPQEFAREEELYNLQFGLNECTFAPIQQLYTNSSRNPRMEVVKTTAGLSAIPVIIKRYHCGYRNMHIPLQEALLQTKVTSVNTCTLYDISIRKGSRNVFEVDLIMERLEEDLESRIKHRKIPYTETELLYILECITDALLFAKLRVRITQGVSHRDIKPANIFTDGKGKYKLGDFGSACSVSRTEIITADGTIAYMSPEMRRQMLGGGEVEVDYFQSDIFSLGVTMLHLAKLTLPSSISQAFANPQQLKQAVEGEIRGLPYSDGVLSLIRRMLESDPAERPNIEEVFLRLSSTLSIGEGQNEGAIDSESTAESLGEINMLLRHFSSKTINKLKERQLCLLFQQYLARYYHKLERYAEAKAVIEEILLYNADRKIDNQADAIDLWLALITHYSEEGNFIAAEIAHRKVMGLFASLSSSDITFCIQFYYKLGDMYYLQEKWEEAERMLHLCLAKALEISTENEHVVNTLIRLAEIYTKQGKYDTGETYYTKAIEMYTHLFGTEDDRTTKAYLLLSTLYGKNRRFSESEEICLYVLSVLKKKYAEKSQKVVEAEFVLAQHYVHSGRYNEGETLLLHCIQLSERESPEGRRYLVWMYHSLARAYIHQERTHEAQAILTKAARVLEQAPCLDIKTLGKTYLKLGEILQQQGKPQEAVEVGQQVVSLLKATQGEDSAGLEDVYGSLARAHTLRKTPAETEKFTIKYMEKLQKSGKENTLKYASALVNLAESYYEQRKLAEAEACANEGLHIQCHEVHCRVPFFYIILAKVYYSRGQLTVAKESYTIAIAGMKSGPVEESLLCAVALRHLCDVYWSDERYEDAATIKLAVIEMAEREGGQLFPDIVVDYCGLADLYLKLGKLHEAESLYQRVLQLESPARDSCCAFYAYRGLARVYCILNQLDEAKKQCQAAFR